MDRPAAKPKRLNSKVIIAGPANVGKTCLIERFVNNVYAADDPTHGPTLGCDCLQKSIFVDDTEVHLFLYDTAGQERFADMATSYYRIGEVCLLCFDLSNLHSFDNTVWWMRKVVEHNQKCVFILVGTKEDLVQSDEALDISAITRWAEENGIPYFPTSAKSVSGGELIKFLFHTVAEKCIRLSWERQADADAGNVKIGKSAFGEQKGKCC